MHTVDQRPTFIIMRSLAIVAAVLLSSGPAHAEGPTVRAFQQWCREAIQTIDHQVPWTEGGRRCLNYFAGSRDLAGGLSGSSPVCYSDSSPKRTGLITGFLRWTTEHPEHNDKHVAYGVMRTLMEYHRCN